MDNGVLTERETEILRLVATGLANKEIASSLSISPNTVKVHLRNIFEKIGAASRTEAAMYAVREGLVEGLPSTPLPEAVGLPIAQPRPWWKSVWVWLGVGLALTMFAGARLRPWLLPTPIPTSTVLPAATASPAPTATPLSRWQARATMLTARSGLAAAAFENQIYAIGGETDEGVTGALERYDTLSDTWTALQPKPLPVTDIGAAVVGGKIYVPGGRTAEGMPTDVVEVFDPRTVAWSLGPPMPVALSAYALTAFEGKLYLFGGWDGAGFVASVLVLDPDTDTWEEGTPMSSPRGYAGVAVAGGTIHVVGGSSEVGGLRDHFEYSGSLDEEGTDPWVRRASLPAPRSKAGVTAVADALYIVGGEAGVDVSDFVLVYQSREDAWLAVHLGQVLRPWTSMALVPLEGFWYAMGGMSQEHARRDTFAYHAAYILLIPAMTN